MPAHPPGVRAPAFAGQFYPRDADELRHLVDALLANATVPAGPFPKALIAPHAGYVYSGPVAASAYARWLPLRDAVSRVILLGPSHRVSFPGLALPEAGAFATPLGTVPVDAEAVRVLAALPQVGVLEAAHRHEHALEVQLPFLQSVLGRFSLVPLLVGRAGFEEVCHALDAVWGGPETRIVISSDLSHYHPAAVARELDAATARAIEDLKPEAVGDDAACGRVAIRALLLAARHRGLRARAVDLRNSGDTGGPRTQVVGYGAFVFEEGVPVAG
jgi:MEMO1 family protein